MRKIFLFIIVLLCAEFAEAQDNCLNATALCANNTIATTTFGATAAANDPALGCGDFTVNNSVWYTVTAISNGTCDITVGLVNNIPGLEMEAFSGACGSLVTTGACNSVNGPAGSMSISFAVTTGTIYYIMVDGSAGNQEAFTILATSATNSIIGRPVPGFIPSTISGCIPLTVLLQNNTVVSGGTGLSYQWRIDGGPYINATGADTTIVFTNTGSHSVDLKVCNIECGCASATQFIDAEELVAVIVPPINICAEVPVDFSATAAYLPDPPLTPVNIISWDWNFGDPASGSNTANGQNVQHSFSDSDSVYTVTLVVTSTDCGSDTVTVVVNVFPKPEVNAGADQTICESDAALLTATAINALAPVSYQWSGPGNFSCSSCSTTSVTSLPPGGPYNINMHIVDANGCFADSALNIIVNPKPVIDAGNDTIVCRYSSLNLLANAVVGNPPFTFSWSPAAGLSDPSDQSPVAWITSPVTYCVVVTDSVGCTADTSCINIDVYPDPVLSSAPGALCASDPVLQTSFTVSGAGAGSVYSWTLSPDFSLITSSNADSSTIGVTFPPGMAATYDFTCVVTDGVTGCRDTIMSSFQVVTGLNMTINVPAQLCQGDSVIISANGAATYTWTASPAYPFTNPAQSTQVVSPAVPTVFTVTGMTGTCSQVLTDSIVVYPKPTVTVSNDSTVCRGFPVQIFSNASGGTPGYTYSWSPSAGLNSASVLNPVATINAPVTYCVVVTDSRSCESDNACVNLNIFPVPTVSAAPSTLCATEPNLQTQFTVGGASAGSFYSWYLSPNYSLISAAAIDSSTVTITLPPGIASTYNFVVVVTDAVTGCSDTIPQSFTVTPGLNMFVIGNDSVCEGESTVLTAGGAAGYTWSASPPYVFANPNASSQSVAPFVTTVFSVTGTTGSCSQVISYTVTVNASPDAVASPISLFCGCDTVSLSGILSTPGMNYNWTSTGGNPVINPNQVNASSLICTTDLFVLIVTDPATGCSDTSGATASQNPLPQASASVSPDLICDLSVTTVLLDGSGSDTTAGTYYLWTSNNPSTFFAGDTSLSTTAVINTATIFYLTVTDSLGCDTVVSDTVNIYPTPTANAANPFICTSDPVLQSTINITGAGAGSLYLWDSIPSCVVPNSASSSSQTFDFTSCGTGVYDFYITVTDGISGCIRQVHQTVTVVNGVVLVTSPDATICEGDSVQLNVSGANSFSWNPGGDTASSVTFAGLTAAGSPHQIIVTGTIGTCVTSDTILITVNPSPQTTPVNGPIFVCDGAMGVIYTVNPADTNYTWIITNGTITQGQGTATIYVNWDSAGTGTLTVVDTNNFGCPGIPQTITVTINPLPVTPPVTGPDTVCQNSVVTYYVTNQPGSTYSWGVSNGTILGSSTSNIISVQWIGPGTGSVTVSEVNSVGCAGPAVTLVVDIFPIPSTPAIQGNATVCEGDTAQVYSVIPMPNGTYSWTVTGGIIVSGATNDSAVVSWGASGNGSISVIIVSEFGCASPIGSINVTINMVPVVAVTPDSISLCRNIPLQIIGTATTGSILWGTSGSGTFSNDTITSPLYVPSPNDSGMTVLTMIATSLTCGADTEQVFLNIIPAPVVNVTALPDTICYGDNVSLTATGGGTYLWSTGSTTSSFFATPLNDSVFYVTVNNAFNCPASDSVTVYVTPPGTVFLGNDVISCGSDSVEMFGGIANAGGLVWSTAGDGYFSDSLAQATTYFPGSADTTSGSVLVTAITTGACLNLTDTVLVQFGFIPAAFAGNDTTVVTEPGSAVSILLQHATSNTTPVYWSTSGTGTFSPNDSTLNATYTIGQGDLLLDSVVLTLVTNNQCGTAIDYLVIDFTPFTIPNVITPFPGTPGYNDYFEIKNLPDLSSLKIWDRWGLLVYVSDNYRNDWDAHGLAAEDFYFILDTRQKKYHGWLKVLRDEK